MPGDFSNFINRLWSDSPKNVQGSKKFFDRIPRDNSSTNLTKVHATTEVTKVEVDVQFVQINYIFSFLFFLFAFYLCLYCVKAFILKNKIDHVSLTVQLL